MKTKSKTEIVVETCRVVTIKSRDRGRLAWCPDCGRQTQMVTADEAALLCRISARAIYVRLEANQLHFIETPDGLVLICADSLARSN